ncbi:hypothetical protein [Coleofasciculus sp. G2-EDA-02]|uniref:hypothetical protein n=1 Tax=Coleofasciculus sp. G2-EDA-02 TaxID=3069529 RepID=UPI0032F11734
MNFDKNYQKCLHKLIWATHKLDVKVPQTQLAHIARIIVQTMMGPWRYFHSVEHILEVGGSTDAIEVLAALFHDIIYVQVDGCIPFNLTPYLAPFIEEERGKFFVRKENTGEQDTLFEIVATLFKVTPGEELFPFTGQNEFLSAIVAAKLLEPLLTPGLIVQVIACIEATIPFRTQSDFGLSPSEELYQCLKFTNQRFNLNLTDTEIIESVKRSVRLANRDVGGFAHPSSAVFLSNTWNLLPETNHNLNKSGSYTVRDYRVAIQKMAVFMKFLNAELIFRQFRGEPNDLIYLHLVEQARRNLEVARLYLDSKLVANAILEALSLRLGSDVPLTIMMGDFGDEHSSIGRLGDSFPTLINPYRPKTVLECEVWQLLVGGRAQGISFDFKTSPLTSFVVQYIGFEGICQMWQRTQEFFQGTITSEEFLASCDTDLVDIVINEVAKLLEKRKVALCPLYQPLSINRVKQLQHD